MQTSSTPSSSSPGKTKIAFLKNGD
jgi:Dual specificity protein phosphatase, N-terminal half